MRQGMLLAISCWVIGPGLLEAQERVPPPPQPLLPSAPVPIAPPPGSPAPYTLQPAPYPPPVQIPYPPPVEAPGAPYPPAVIVAPAGNPSFWVGAEALLWWIKNQPLPVPVITTGPASQGDNAGGLGQSGTVSLTTRPSFDPVGGIRIFAGGWFDAMHTIGLEGSFFDLDRQRAGFDVFDRSGTGQLVINEPVAGAPFTTQVSAPGAGTGGVAIDASSRFSGADLNLLYNLWRSNRSSVNLVGGFRYYELDENLTITGSSTVFTTETFQDNLGNVLATAPPGSNITAIDFFGTHNQFYGGQVGVQFQTLVGRWFFSGTGKLALGDMHESVHVFGNTFISPVNAAPVTLSGGNFATLQSGRYSFDRFAVAPEVQLNVGYQFTPALRALIGYNFLYLSSVARPGNQIDNTYDGAVHPLVPLTGSSFWAQGLNFSLQFNY